jgi:hypothetical protein
MYLVLSAFTSSPVSLVATTRASAFEGNTNIVQMTEENTRIQAGGELREKVENIKIISFLVCTATLSFADVIGRMKIG